MEKIQLYDTKLFTIAAGVLLLVIGGGEIWAGILGSDVVRPSLWDFAVCIFVLYLLFLTKHWQGYILGCTVLLSFSLQAVTFYFVPKPWWSLSKYLDAALWFGGGVAFMTKFYRGRTRS